MLVEKINQLFVLLTLANYCFVTSSFDLWMLKGAYDIFAIVIKFLGVNWNSKHITIRLFETSDISRHALAKNLTKLLGKYDLRKKIIAYVKDEGSNLNIMIVVLKFIVSCNVLGLIESF
jgi:hypothetical protein